MAEVDTDFVAGAAPTLASLVGLVGSAGVMVPWLLVEEDLANEEDFLEGVGELQEDDFLDMLGEPIEGGTAPLLRLLLLSSTTLSGLGSNLNKSATRGDSVSLKAKSSVSVCLDALITSTHFSVHTAASLYRAGSAGSSTSLHSPTPIERTTFSFSGSMDFIFASAESPWTTIGRDSSSLHCSPTEMTNGRRFSCSPTWQPASDISAGCFAALGPLIASSSTTTIALCKSGHPMISSSVLKTASWMRFSISCLETMFSMESSVEALLPTILTLGVLEPWLILAGGGGDGGGGSVLTERSLVSGGGGGEGGGVARLITSTTFGGGSGTGSVSVAASLVSTFGLLGGARSSCRRLMSGTGVVAASLSSSASSRWCVERFACTFDLASLPCWSI